MNSTIYGLKFIYGIARRKLKNIVIYTTDRCNSKCKTCFIWKKQPKTDIPVAVVEKILNDETSKGAIFKITGGEFLLHPKYREILLLLNELGVEYQLFSNGSLADRLIETVREFKIKEVAISCDGVGEKYKEIRGIDDFENIIKITDDLQNETSITLNYTISPLNSKSDLKQVINFANTKNIKLVVGVFGNLEYFDVKMQKREAYNLDGVSTKCLRAPKGFVNKYIELYNKWVRGEYKIPCLNIRSQAAVYPNGEVHLCEGKNLVLGNLSKKSLKNIWNSEKTIQLQKQNKNCNACFLICQRPIDVVINSTPLDLIKYSVAGFLVK